MGDNENRTEQQENDENVVNSVKLFIMWFEAVVAFIREAIENYDSRDERDADN